jgi:opacity protein-like surface antigen
MSSYRLAAIVVLCVGIHAELRAQRVEIQPFVGTRFGGSFSVEEPIPGGTRPADINLDAGLAWGATLGVAVSERLDVEFLWSRQESHLSADTFEGHIDLVDAAVSQYHGNVLFHFADREARFRPYVLFGLGATSLDPDAPGVDGATKFSYAAGGGVKFDVSKHVGIRLQGRFTATYLKDEPALFCDLFGFCYVLSAAQYGNQGEFTAGVMFRF